MSWPIFGAIGMMVAFVAVLLYCLCSVIANNAGNRAADEDLDNTEMTEAASSRKTKLLEAGLDDPYS